MALVDLTSVTTGNIGTNTNFIVEENKVLKRISQSSLLKTSAISTTQVNSTTNVPSSSLVYSMNQSINKLNSELINGSGLGLTEGMYSIYAPNTADDMVYPGLYRLNGITVGNRPDYYGYAIVMSDFDHAIVKQLIYHNDSNQAILRYRYNNQWVDAGDFALKDDLSRYVPFAANLPSNQKFYIALVPGEENRIYFYSDKEPIGENAIGYIALINSN